MWPDHSDTCIGKCDLQYCGDHDEMYHACTVCRQCHWEIVDNEKMQIDRDDNINYEFGGVRPKQTNLQGMDF